MLVDWLAAVALAVWLVVALLPSRPWSTRERLEPASPADDAPYASDLSCISVLIPARNEAESIAETIHALIAQGRGVEIFVIDDQSEDETARRATEAGATAAAAGDVYFELVVGRSLPEGWGGKLFALEQGLERVSREYCLLLDAEIRLEPGIVSALLDKAESEGRAMVSIMARLRCVGFWERLLVPAFIFFFKLLYPFAGVNSPRRRTAAAAGGCILIRTEVLREIGGFAALRDALIDDCTLARRVKRAGHSIWLGLSEAVTSARAYPGLASFRRMVSRTAFTQLGYSTPLLIAVCLAMFVAFVVPWYALVFGPTAIARLAGVITIGAMTAVYWPLIKFYRLPVHWALTLPLAAMLFLGMTIESAVSYWRGVRAEWKGRIYASRP